MNRTYAKKIKKYLIILFRTLLVVGLCYTILKPIIQYILYAFMSPEDFTDWTVSMIPKNWSAILQEISFKSHCRRPNMMTTKIVVTLEQNIKP